MKNLVINRMKCAKKIKIIFEALKKNREQKSSGIYLFYCFKNFIKIHKKLNKILQKKNAKKNKVKMLSNFNLRIVMTSKMQIIGFHFLLYP